MYRCHGATSEPPRLSSTLAVHKPAFFVYMHEHTNAALGRQASPFLFRILLSRYHIYGAILPAAIVFLRRYKKRRVRRFSRVSSLSSPPRGSRRLKIANRCLEHRDILPRPHPSSFVRFLFNCVFLKPSNLSLKLSKV